ncbi:hypothetical protein [Paenibacillus selenitireducens]|uniref:hypothetical protein n=1 Tax=Paenibacillus selenitireducens TaxID=1324314 RepID=UPI001301A795|nr:hypothetical protein [Paenibacillus selenitireducens]
MSEEYNVESIQGIPEPEGKLEIDVLKVLQQLGISEEKWLAELAQMRTQLSTP